MANIADDISHAYQDGYSDGYEKGKEDAEFYLLHCGDTDEPQTNADRIRSMTDEELAEFMRPWNSGCPRWKENPLPCSDWDNCGECWLKWLKEEVKDG